MQKRFWVLFILTIALNPYAFGQTNASGIDTGNNSILWRITAKNSTKPSYLFGTMHQICPNDYLWTKAMQSSLEQCDAICFEMDLADNSVLKKVSASLLDNNGKLLKDYFTAKEYERVKAYFKDSLHTNIEIYETIKLIAVDLLLSAKIAACIDATSYEDRIMSWGKEKTKKIYGLEAAEEQIALLESIPTDSIKSDILQIISGIAERKEAYSDIVNLYKSQKLPELFTLLINNKELGESMDPLLGNRNKKWIPKIEQMLSKQSVFIAVGCGHLWGEDGVIQLLKNEGYVVTPIK
jgi:uncharacterized protein